MPFSVFGAEILIDSYSKDNQSGGWPIYHSTWGYGGQSFTNLVNTSITRAVFYGNKNPNKPLIGPVYAELWSHTGEYGTSSKPLTLLATSDVINPLTIRYYNYEPIIAYFTGVNQYEMIANTKYVIVLHNLSPWDVTIAIDNSPTHSGNACSANYVPIWTVRNFDFIF